MTQSFGTLNEAVDSDTTSTGERDGIYLLNGSIDHDFALTIVAAEGSGARPVLQPGIAEGGESSRPFRSRADITLRGLHLTNRDELGGLNTRILRVSADDVRITIDDCHFDEDAQSGIRLDNENNRIFISNSIFSRIGLPLDPNNGRGIDDRGNPIDSLVIQNSTFYNLTSTVLRDGGGIIRYADINHNTVVNIGQRGFDFGEIQTLHFTNNVVINAGYLGAAPADDDPAFPRNVIIVDTLGVDIVGDQVVNVRNNNFYTDQALIDALHDSVTSILVLGTFNALAADLVEASGTGATNTSEAIAFANPPASVEPIITAYYIDPATAPAWDNASAPYDFLYSGGESSTGSTGGQPLGSLTWHTLDIVDSDRTTSLVVDDGGTGDAVELPTGDIGPIGLDLDLAAGDQMVRQTATNPVAGDEVTIDIIITEGASGEGGLNISLLWNPAELTYKGYVGVDIFSGGIVLTTPGNIVAADSTADLSVVFLGNFASKDSGSGGQATFTVNEGFSGVTTVTLTAAKLGGDVTIGPGAALL